MLSCLVLKDLNLVTISSRSKKGVIQTSVEMSSHLANPVCKFL
jgi:hypothetical protein